MPAPDLVRVVLKADPAEPASEIREAKRLPVVGAVAEEPLMPVLVPVRVNVRAVVAPLRVTAPVPVKLSAVLSLLEESIKPPNWPSVTTRVVVLFAPPVPIKRKVAVVEVPPTWRVVPAPKLAT